MAKYNELKEIRGTIDDLVFYTLNGKQVVRKKSGFNTEAFKNNPNYKKVKENSTEFGHCSKASKMLRTALSSYVENCGDKLMYQKFTKVMTNIKNLDTQSEHGKRRIEIGLKNENALTLLKQFQFGELPNLDKIATREIGLFNESIRIHSAMDEAELIFLQPDFNTYQVETKVEKHSLTGKRNEIEIPINDDRISLLFLVLKKKNKINHLGFL